MFRHTRRIVVILGLLAALALPAGVSADHAWGTYHWARTADPFTLKLGDDVSGAWDAHLAAASTDCSLSTVLDTSIVAGSTTARKCKPKLGRVEVCGAAYGLNGWLGVAQIWITGGTHIAQGTVKLNDSYFKTATYNTPAWRQFVICQEIGHTFGLDHQDEAFDNGNLGSCMDYTSNPSGPLSNEKPNQHDYDQLVAIYGHVDSTNTVLSSTRSSGAGSGARSDWGREVSSARGGHSSVFVRDHGNGQATITFVIWAR